MVTVTESGTGTGTVTVTVIVTVTSNFGVFRSKRKRQLAGVDRCFSVNTLQRTIVRILAIVSGGTTSALPFDVLLSSRNLPLYFNVGKSSGRSSSFSFEFLPESMMRYYIANCGNSSRIDSST